MINNRVLVLLNEYVDFSQIGFRRTFNDLTSAGLLGSCEILSPQRAIQIGEDIEDVHKEILTLAKALKPTIVFVAHPQRMRFDSQFFEKLYAICSPKILVWEGDVYSIVKKQPTWSLVSTLRASDAVFAVATGRLKRLFRSLGAQNVQWVPHCFEPDRLGAPLPSSTLRFDVDVTVIANSGKSLFRSAPGWKRRADFVGILQEEFGDRLALYGRGWEGVGYRGPLSFDKQTEALRASRISANWDHYDTLPHYFSNRLPISLASGSIHATTRHKGYEEIFESETRNFLITEGSPRTLADSIIRFLGGHSDNQLREIAGQAANYANSKFRQDDWIVKMLNSVGAEISLEASRDAWSK